VKKKISIILPVYNEERAIASIYKAIIVVISGMPEYLYEVIFVNDGSVDNSWNEIKKLSQKDKYVKGISFGRNFGHQIALKAGYDSSSGDAVISMDSDLQHPPQLILKMIKKWEKGFEVVYVEQIKRRDGVFKRVPSLLYYRLLNYVSQITIPKNVGDFRLLDRKVVLFIKSIKTKSLYLRGLVPWSGFSSTSICAEYSDRVSGKSSYTYWKMFKLAFDGITALSLFPLKLAAIVGAFVVFTGIILLLIILIDFIFYNSWYPLFKWLATVTYIFVGVLFILLWILGEYVGKIYEETKNYPQYVVVEKTNLE